MSDQRLATRLHTQAEGRRLVPLSIALGALIIAAFSAFFPVLDSSGWWFGCVVVVIAVNGVAAGLRAAGVPRLLGSAGGALIGVLTLTALCGGETGFVRLIPTPETLGRFVELSQSAGESIYRQSIPADADAGISFLLIFASLMAAASTDLMAIGAGAVAPVGLIALAIAIPPSILMEEIPVIAFAVTALAYVAVLWSERARARQAGGVTRMLAIGVVAASIAGIGASSVPGFYGENPFSVSNSRSSFASGVSPLLHLGEDLQSNGDSTQFRYRSTSETPTRFRLMTLEAFDGSTWTSTRERSGLFPVESGTDLVRGEAEDVPPGEPRKTAVSIEGLRDRLLPLPDGAIEVRGADGTWLWDPSDETIRSRTDSTVGLDYTVSSVRSEPTAERLRAADIPDRGIFAAEREIPSEVPDIITHTLDDVIDGIESPYERAYAIQTFLRDGDFTYSLSAPVAQGYDGDSLGVIATFLQRKAGYCVHFAATMATMARMIDVPSRIVLGFLPGDEDGDEHVVRADDLHAWPELFFEGVGWVPFEPTPGRGGTPSYAPEPTSTAEANAPDDVDPRTIERSSAPNETETADAEAATPTASDDDDPSLVPVGFIGLGILALFAIPASIRALRRARRLSRAGARREGAGAAWTEISDTARDLGWQHPISDTPRMLSERLLARIGSDDAVADALGRLVRLVEQRRFGPPGETGSPHCAADARTVIAALESAATRAERAKAKFWPITVFSRGVQPTTNLAR